MNNWDSLEPEKAGYVPSDGVLLYPITVEFEDGETVFDILNRVCASAGIQLEYSWTPMYNSYYVEGIGNLYEFDCRRQLRLDVPGQWMVPQLWLLQLHPE